MKRPIILSVLITLFVSTSLLSAQQNDSIKHAILNYPNSDLELISKGRALTMEHLNKGDLPALSEIKEYLAREAGGAYKAYLPVEYWLLSFWAEDYQLLLNEAKHIAMDTDVKGDLRITPEFLYPSPLVNLLSEIDQLMYEVANKSADSYTPLTVAIDAAELNNEEKDFLKMWLYSILFAPSYSDNEEGMEAINQMADEFLTTYSNSAYAPYTRHYIRRHFRPEKWGLGYEFFLGYNTLAGAISNQFSNNMVGGFAFDLLYRKFDLSLRFNYSSTNNKSDLIHKGVTWPSDVRGYMVGGDIALHYPLYQNRKIKLQPFVGIGGMGTSPLEEEIKKNAELENFKELSVFHYLTGVDLKMNLWNPKVNLARDGGFSLGLRYSFYKRKYDLMPGNMHMITVSFGGFGKPLKRVF